MKTASIEYRMFGQSHRYTGDWPNDQIADAVGEAMAKAYSEDRTRKVQDAGAAIEELIVLAGGTVLRRNSVRDDGSIRVEDFSDLKVY
jgi:L-arabinose isomerase